VPPTCADLEQDRLYHLSGAPLAAGRAVVSFLAGTGFVISPEGDILTNAHVAESFGRTGRVYFDDGEGGVDRSLLVTLMRVEPALDVALYRTEATDPLPWLRLADDVPPTGDPVCMLMNPNARGERVGVGLVVGQPARFQGIPSLRYDVPSMWGASGSPVVDRRGDVVAMHWGWRSGVDFGVSADALRDWLAEPPPAARGPAPASPSAAPVPGP
jgi:serine protease Do